MKTIILPTNSLRSSLRRCGLLLIPLLPVCFGLLPKAQAVSPPPDGGYLGGNTAEGQSALFSLTTGGYNTAVGFFSLRSNTTNRCNTAVGAGTLIANAGDENTATGAGALLSNTAGAFNTAVGFAALASNTIGFQNSALGWEALHANTTGIANTAIGYAALYSTTAPNNTAVGNQALSQNTTGSGNVALGAGAGTGVFTANNVICIGASVAGVDVTGSCFIGNIRGVTTINNDAIPVLIDSVGQLGTASSSVRFKKEIKPMDKASEAILALKPVSFHYKSDKTNRPEFGLIAEEVAEVNGDLVVRNTDGEIYTVRYDAVNAMLLNEFLKEHKKVEKQEATITQLKNDFQTVSTQQRKEIQLLSAQLYEQATQIQKVSAQFERANLRRKWSPTISRAG
jgi:hypothetical protein